MADCTWKTKDNTGKEVQCEGKPANASAPCPKRGEHISKIRTGFCSSGFHEGSKGLTYNGNNAPTCTYWKTCPCDCHKQFDAMYSMVGKERIAQNNSGYVAHQDFVQPWRDGPAVSDDPVAPVRVNAPVVIQSELPGVIPATLGRDYGPTATGRTARGELEAWVKKTCDGWLVDTQDKDSRYVRPCSPQYVSEEIAEREGVKPPSVGAIDAVYKRWEEIGFAKIERKPTRFVAYTELGIQLTLEGCKEKAKRAKKFGGV